MEQNPLLYFFIGEGRTADTGLTARMHGLRGGAGFGFLGVMI